MRSEILTISPSKIDVKYEFFNRTSQPITETVAFPMPEITVDCYDDGDFDYPLGDFTTTIDGHSIETEMEEKSFLKGKDISNYLKELGIPLDPRKFDIETIKETSIEELKSKNIWPCDDRESQNWEYRQRYYRKQTFPPQTITRVRHQYTPSKSSSAAGVPSYYDGFPCKDKYSRWLESYLPRSGMQVEYLSYILTTGRNWAGGAIGDFTLILDKEKEKNFVDICIDGIKKISPTQFEVRKKNFVPKHDLGIVFVHVAD